jgi:hypothetical protein
MHEFFFNIMVPWVHYVPVWHPQQAVSVIEYLLANPDVAERIGRNGQEFVEQHLTRDGLSCYFHYLSRAYAKKLSADKIVRMPGTVKLATTPNMIFEQYGRISAISIAAVKGEKSIAAHYDPQDDYLPHAGLPN